MKKETNSSAWLSTFLAGFLATVLGILLTFGVQGLINSGKRNRTARLLAEQTVEKMDRTYQELHEYLELYNSVDSTIICLSDAIAADTLDRVDNKTIEDFLVYSLSEYVQAEVDSGMDAYIAEILNTIGDVALIGHIDRFYDVARQCEQISQQVIDQKRVVSDMVYAHFYGKEDSVTHLDYVRFLLNMPEYTIFFSRMRQARYPMQEGEQVMLDELNACKEILK